MKLYESYKRLSPVGKIIKVWLPFVAILVPILFGVGGKYIFYFVKGDITSGDKVGRDKIVIYTDSTTSPSFDFNYDASSVRFVVGSKVSDIAISKVEWFIPGALQLAANPIYTSNSKSLSHKEVVMAISWAVLPFFPGFPESNISQNKITQSVACHTEWLSDHPNDQEGIPIGIKIQYSLKENQQASTYIGYIYGLQPPVLGRDAYPEIKNLKKASENEWITFLNDNAWLKAVALKIEERNVRIGNNFSRLDEHYQCVR